MLRDDHTITFVELFNAVYPSIVALGSLAVRRDPISNELPPVPDILGTAFVVDPRGIAVTAGHVGRTLQALPVNPQTGRKADVAIIFRRPERRDGGWEMWAPRLPIRSYSILTDFTVRQGPFYGEKLPDFCLIQLGVQGLPPLSFNAAPNTLCTGAPVAFVGFPRGSDALRLNLDDAPPILLQMMPFLRHGVISSVNPFPCPNPNGFTVDAASHGGASGSPIFTVADPRVIGMLYAAWPGSGPAYALPAVLLEPGVGNALSNGTLNMAGIPTIEEWERIDTSTMLGLWELPDP